MCSGSPSSRPNITSVTPLSSSTSFTVSWIISDPNYNYTVIWTNLNTGVTNSATVPVNTNSYTVTGLNDNDKYNVSVAAVNMCGDMTSDPVTVNCEFAYTYVYMYVYIIIMLILCNFIFYIWYCPKALHVATFLHNFS